MTTTLIKGLGVSGAGIKSVALRRGELMVTLASAVRSVAVNMSGPLLTESSRLQGSVANHKVRSVTLTLSLTDAKHATTSVPAKLTAR